MGNDTIAYSLGEILKVGMMIFAASFWLSFIMVDASYRCRKNSLLERNLAAPGHSIIPQLVNTFKF